MMYSPSPGDSSTGSSVLPDDPTSFQSPPPNPDFYSQFESPLTTKRERRCHSRFGPMARAVRTAPPLYRISHRRVIAAKPSQLTFRDKRGNFTDICREVELHNSHYNPEDRTSYFEQCFHVERQLGSGSFGEVNCVVSKEDGRRYAVKRALEPFRSTMDRNIKLREVAKHEQLSPHPNLIKFIKAWQEEGRLYIQTELCTTSLSALIDLRHDLPKKQIWNVFLDILNAVDYLHSKNLLHLDIKPDNIFLAKDNVCKLGDFGLIFDLQHDQKNTAEEGDSKYLAPELLNHSPTKAADIFSLGITILEVATDLDLPSRGESWSALRSGAIPGRFLDMMDRDLRRLVIWMMAPEPSMRPSTKDLLIDEAVIWPMRKRTVYLHIHTAKTRVFSCIEWAWLWFVAFVHVMIIPLRSFMDLLNSKRKDVCRTPYRSELAPPPRSCTPNTPHTPHTLFPNSPFHHVDYDSSFSDDENFVNRQYQQSRLRQKGERARHSMFAPMEPFHNVMHNSLMDGRGDESPCLLEDGGDSPPNSKALSPLSLRRRPPRRDGAQKIPRLELDDPFTERTQIRHSGRTPPRLDFSILDSPAKKTRRKPGGISKVLLFD